MMARSLEMAGLRTFEYFSQSMALFEPVYSFEPTMTLERSILFAVVLIPASSTILQGCSLRYSSRIHTTSQSGNFHDIARLKLGLVFSCERGNLLIIHSQLIDIQYQINCRGSAWQHFTSVLLVEQFCPCLMRSRQLMT